VSSLPRVRCMSLLSISIHLICHPVQLLTLSNARSPSSAIHVSSPHAWIDHMRSKASVAHKLDSSGLRPHKRPFFHESCLLALSLTPFSLEEKMKILRSGFSQHLILYFSVQYCPVSIVYNITFYCTKTVTCSSRDLRAKIEVPVRHPI
jgi:hypothetical protein